MSIDVLSNYNNVTGIHETFSNQPDVWIMNWKNGNEEH